MLHVPNFQVASHVLVTMVGPVTVHHVLTSTSVTTSMLVVITLDVSILKEASCAHAILVSKVMPWLDVLTSMNVKPLTVVTMLHATIWLVHSHVTAMTDIPLAKVVSALISTNVLLTNVVTIKTVSIYQDPSPAFVTLDLPPVQLLKVSLVSTSMNVKPVTITAVPTQTAKTIQELSHVLVTLVSVVMVSHVSTSMNAKKMPHVTPPLPTVLIPMVHSLVNVTMVSKVQVLVMIALISTNVPL